MAYRKKSKTRKSGDFRRKEKNTTQTIPEKGSRLTGRKNAIFLRNKYQKELDNAYADVVNMVHYLETKNKELKQFYNKAQTLKQDIQAHENERVNLYESLGNLLNKETDFEDNMWSKTIKNIKTSNVTIKNKFKDSDIDEMRYNAMEDYLKQYPEYASKSSFKSIHDNIKTQEQKIRKKKQQYNQTVGDYNTLLSIFDKWIVKSDNKINSYHKIKEEGEKRLQESRYVGSTAYNLASEKTKSEVSIDTLSHRMQQFIDILNLIKSEFTEAKKQSFVELSY